MKNRDTAKKCISTFITLFFLLSTAYAQQSQISGTVTEAANGEPLAGVNVLVQGASIGTSTNAEGMYSLSIPDTSDVLVFSFIGYATQQVQINGRSNIDVVLESQTVAGEEIVVVGYGTQRKSDLTGSISTVDVKEVKEIPTSNLQDALQGKVAGLQVTPTNGQPGAQPIVRIRGVGTLGDTSPLYVVDGLLTNDISYLNPQNVESVQVLKDASATAVYGSRGANGVIIITTEQGRPGQTQISATSYFGFQQVADRIGLANANEFATLANESAVNSGNSPVFENPDQFGAGTDYQDVIFDDMAPIQNYSISASGGSDNYVYSVGATYFKQDGVVRGSNFQRVGLRLNNEYFLSDFVSVGHNISFNFDDRTNPANDLVNAALRADPTLPPRQENGDFTNLGQNGGAANPAAAIAFNENDNFGFRTAGNAYLNIEFLQNLNLNSSFALDLERDQEQNFNPVFFVSPIQQNELNNLRVENINRTDYIIKNTLEYKEEIQQHRFDLLGGITVQKTVTENLQGARTGFPNDNPALRFLQAGDPTSQTNVNESAAIGRISYIFRGNYVYDDRYLFTGTYRIDGSSIFGENNRYGFFPSVALGWRVSEEPFFDVPEISNLKIRGSWGRVGNDKIPPNSGVATVNSDLSGVFGEDEQIVPGATVTDLANPEILFEEVEQFNIGFELGMFDDRLTTELDYYSRETNDILVNPPIPAAVGAAAPFVNAASVRNKGFDLSVNWQNNSGDFTYSVGFVGSSIDNEVLDLGRNQGDAIFAGNAGNNLGLTTRTAVGGPIGAFFGFRTVGVFQDQQEVENSPTLGDQQVGDLRFADLNGDGDITDADRTVLGSPIPDFTLGVNLSGAYRGIDLSLSLDGQFGNQILNARRGARGFRLLNYSDEFLDRFTGPGTSNDEPRITESGVNYQVDRFLQDGDFVRLRNIQLGYSLPVSLTENLSVRGIRVYANASNLLTLTDYTGYNPQIANTEDGVDAVLDNGIDRGVFPIATAYTFGIELDF